jgi:hypothetical protein
MADTDISGIGINGITEIVYQSNPISKLISVG